MGTNDTTKPGHAGDAGDAEKNEAATNPTRDDFHEQREPEQTRESVVKKEGAAKDEPPRAQPPKKPEQRELDRAAGEGMGQPQAHPPARRPSRSSTAGR